MKRIAALGLLLALAACKTGAGVSEKKANDEKTVFEIIHTHYNQTLDFETANIRGTAYFQDKKQSQNVNLDIRIKKNESILINVKVLGFSMAKALITPREVKFYEKVNSQYFEGNFDFLSQWLGTPLDFNKIQNLLLGQAMNDLSKETFIATIESGLHKLEPKSKNNLKEAYFFEDQALLLKKEELSQPDKKRKIMVHYPTYQKFETYILPSEIKIEAEQEKSIHLNLRYNKISFNEDLNFPYSVPSNYKRITIK